VGTSNCNTAGHPYDINVINFLEARCKALELLQANQSTSTTTSQQSPTSKIKVSQSSRCNLVIQDQCPLCKGTHRLVQCGKFKGMPPWQRKDYAQQIRPCYNCLRPYSKSHNCSKDLCHVCNKRHHTLLHVNAQISSASDRRSNTNHNPSANQRNSAPPEVNTYCSLKSKPTNHVLLATATVEVKNKYNQYVPCHVLLVSASQLNFISEKCVQRLRLSRTQTPVLIQGVNKVNTTTHHSVSLHLRSRQTDWHTTVKCAVLPHITSNTPASKLDISTWRIPTDIKLADEQFNQPGAIDTLIGADLFYELLLPNRRTRISHPVLQERVLGWIISGKTPVLNNQRTHQHSFLLRENTSFEQNLSRFWEVEPMDEAILTPEHEACEQHFITHTTP